MTISRLIFACVVVVLTASAVTASPYASQVLDEEIVSEHPGYVYSGFKWPQDVPGGYPPEYYEIYGPPTPAYITYSYVNLLDGSEKDDIVRAIIEEALGLWASYSPLDFTEVVDPGDYGVIDEYYLPNGQPDIRFGLHEFDVNEVAHAFYPRTRGGVGGDVHFNSDKQWALGPVDLPYIDLLEVAVHEIGHALGLEHVQNIEDGGAEVIMNPNYIGRFSGLGSAYLLPGDIEGIQSIYGQGQGTVTPLPEPTTGIFVFIGVMAAIGRRNRRS